jgi:hypothetical protein
MQIPRFPGPTRQKTHEFRHHLLELGFLKALQIHQQIIIELHQGIIPELKMNIIMTLVGMPLQRQGLLPLNRQGVTT